MSTDFLDNPFRPSNSVFEPDPWLDQFNQLWYDYFNDRDPADDFDDFDRIEREQEANRLVDLLEAYHAGTIGYEQFMAEYNTGGLFDEIPGFDDWLEESRNAVQYDSMLNDWAVVSKSGDPQAIQDFVSLYNRTGIQGNPLVQADLASTGSAVSVITGTVDNSILEDFLRKEAIGDGIFGVEVDFEDLPGYGGIWEGLIRHIKVIGKGLPLPIPDWLPLPGIFELPTIGEIFDTVTGPWKTAAQDALRNCMDPDGDGVDDKSASQCMEEQSVIDILTDGIGNATSDIYDATAEKVQEILDETIDCVSNPETCAQEVFDKLKDIFGEGAVDPTSTGGNIPDWMKVIIIGGTYGEEILGELEDLFGGDINDDGTIGVTDPNTFDCSSIGKSGGMVPDASYCGDCSDANQNDFGNGCEPVCQYDNAIPASSSECVEPWEDTGPSPQECSNQNRVHIPGDTATQTPSSCGECLTGFEEVGDQCQEEEDPITNNGPTAAECAAENRGFNPATDLEDSSCGECLSGFIEEDGVCVEGTDGTDDGTGCAEVDCNSPQPTGTWAGPEIRQQWMDCCGSTNCPEDGSLISDHPNNDCSIPIPTGEGGCPDGSEPQYALNDLDQDGYYEFGGNWYQYDPCNPDGGQTQVFRCNDGSFEANEEDCPVDTETPQEGEPCDSNGDGQNDGTIVNGECVANPQEECAKPDGTPTGATPESNCEQCPQGFTFDFNGICQPDVGFSCDDYNRTTNEDGSCGPCKEGYVQDTSLPNEPCVAIFDGCPPGYELVNGQCTQIVCPEGQAYCIDTDGCVEIGTCPSDPPEPDEDGGGGGGGGGGFTPDDVSFSISGDPQLLGRARFGTQDFVTPLFTGNQGGGTDFPIARFLQGKGDLV